MPQTRIRPDQIGVMAGLALAFMFMATAFAALTFPALTGRVVDEAGILDAGTRASLTQKLAALEAKSTDQLVVVTLKSLQGTSVEDFGVQLFRAWKIGQKDKNNGVLLIVAPNERKVRIEVGRGLEGTLTDAITRIIIENSILPRFRANDFPGGVVRGVDDIISAITDNEEWKQRAAKRSAPKGSFLGPAIALLALGLVVAVILTVMFRSLNGRQPAAGAKRRSGSDGWWASSGSWGAAGSSGSSDSSWSSSSDSGGSFSGGGGDSGGGGSSGSW